MATCGGRPVGILALLMVVPLTGTAQNPGLSSSWFALNVYSGVNQEQECYSPAQVATGSSGLVITAAAQQTACSGTPEFYTSGAVVWAPPLTWQYGTIEFYAEMAGGQGPWPAIWLLGHNCQPSGPTIYNAPTCQWPNPGSDEIDIAEILNSNHASVNQEIHTTDASGVRHDDSCRPMVTDVSRNYHLYEMDWSPGSLTWKIDGTQTCSITKSYVPSSRMYLIINVAVGGTTGGTPDNSTFPASTTVKYIKMCTSTSGCSNPGIAAPDPTGSIFFDNFSVGGPTDPTKLVTVVHDDRD